MFTHDAAPARPLRRRLARATSVVLLATVTVLVSAGAASADTPSAWDDAPSVSGLEFVLVLLLIPAGLFAVISLLAALPSMIGDKGYEPGQSWRSEPEWFGGAATGVDGANAGELTEGSGDADQDGISGRW